MKAAIEFAPWRDQLAKPRRSTDAWYKVAGLVVAVGFPTLFWVAALGLLTQMSVAGLASIGLVIAAIVLVGAVIVTAEARLK